MGNPRIRVFDGIYPTSESDSPGFSRTIVSSTSAYSRRGLKHLSLDAKEHLGALNGTAFSAAVASLALMDALQVGMLAMVCTAMGTEALLGHQG